MYSVVHKISEICIKKELLEAENREVYEYFLEAIISAIMNSICILAISIIFNEVIASIIFVFGYALLRTSAGGYHAKTRLSCLLSFLFIYLVCLLLFKLDVIQSSLSTIFPLILILSSIFAVFFIAPVEHPDLPLTNSERKKQKVRSRKMVILWNALCFFILFIPTIPRAIPIMGIEGSFAASMLLIIARRVYDGKTSSKSYSGCVGEGSPKEER